MIGIGARYLECLLASLPAIREVCVVPSSSADGRHEYHAFVVLARNTPSAIYEFQEESSLCLAGLSVKVDILPELPKSPMGRVSREALLALRAEPAA
jgi:acyl-coenzyme A synthetase/AMP-(fatty) acid ligase